MKRLLNKDLNDILKQKRDEYFNNEPFSHVVIENLFDEQYLSSAVEEVENTSGDLKSFYDWEGEQYGKDILEGKQLLHKDNPEHVKGVLSFLNSEDFVSFLQKLTDIPDLFGDSTYRGGGIHQVRRGGKLGIHIDFSRPKWDKSIYRRANILLYLNKDWKEEWGGHLELWDKSIKKGGRCVKKIKPDFNKMVIFGTAKQSWHGHPHPLECPEDVGRMSFAAYYYSPTPGDDLDVHSTIIDVLQK
tara:strand:- start:521 stop:1252 length:732 start_codon:yes stop_codon:yes gene_type:complete